MVDFEVNELDLYKISFKLILSLAIGILFGVERDIKRFSEKEKESIYFGGIRTFGLIGLLGGRFFFLSCLFCLWVFDGYQSSREYSECFVRMLGDMFDQQVQLI